MYIRHYSSSGSLYATLFKAKRIDVIKEDERVMHLGRVVSQENGIFKNRERGAFKHALEGGLGDAADNANYLNNAYGEKKLESILDFGRECVFSEALKKEGIWAIL
ncbi:MAG: hypothetical protein LBU32_17935 [Clostridiales bacterium]|jgi:hypothetical protein|nr:hypothetical protein [Clostridiales bacterium]